MSRVLHVATSWRLYMSPSIGPRKNNDIKNSIHPGFSKDLSKFKTILANEVIIAGPIGPAISIWASYSLAGPFEPARYLLLAQG